MVNKDLDGINIDGYKVWSHFIDGWNMTVISICNAKGEYTLDYLDNCEADLSIIKARIKYLKSINKLS